MSRATPMLDPRKRASQERSRATVDALVEATARILVKKGFEQATTNRIAEEAGVSIGSLYQYFPNKEALVASVIERHKQEMLAILREALEKIRGWPVEKGLRELVAVTIRAHQVDPRLHRVLVEQIPRTGRLADVEGFQQEAHEIVAVYLESCKAELRAIDLDMAAFVCVSSVEALAHEAVLRHEEFIADERVETFIDEVTHLVVQYVRRS